MTKPLLVFNTANQKLYKIQLFRNHHGARYALSWKKLPEANQALLLWMINTHPNDYLSKDQMLKESKITNLGPISGRVAELLALDLLTKKVGEKSKQKLKAAYDSPPVSYRVNLAKASAVLTNDWKLTPQTELPIQGVIIEVGEAA